MPPWNTGLGCPRPYNLTLILRGKGKGTETGKIKEWREERRGQEKKKGERQKPLQIMRDKENEKV